jgi:CBS domain containing-hemolysin-like protein
VVDAACEMVGVLSSDQFSSQNLMRLVSKDVKAKDLTVKDVMQPRADVMGLSYQQLQHCTVGDVLNTLQKAGEPYAVVIDHEKHQIRGIISARDITARLHIAPVQIEKAPTLLNMLNLASA